MQSWCGNLLRYRETWLGGRGVDVSAWERTSHRAGQVGQRRITYTGTCARPPRAIATLAGQCGMTFWLIMLRSRRVESFRQRAKGHGCGLPTSPPRASRLSHGEPGDQRLVPVEKRRPGGPSAGRSGLPSGAREGPGPSRGPPGGGRPPGVSINVSAQPEPRGGPPGGVRVMGAMACRPGICAPPAPGRTVPSHNGRTHYGS